MKKKIPSSKEMEDMRAKLSLDPKSPSGLCWNKTYPAKGNIFPGEPAFTTVGSGNYYNGLLLGKRWLSHIVVWFLYYGVWPREDQIIDHYDGDKLNNNISNLRIVTVGQNTTNKRIKNYSFIPKENIYRVRFRREGKIVFEKRCQTEEEAIAVVIQQKSKLSSHVHSKFTEE